MGTTRVRTWIAACAALTAWTSLAGAEPPDTAAPAAGMRAYADPRTGAPRETPPPGESIPATAAFSRSGSGLAETPGPRGGVMVDLQGRFKSPLVATVAPDGTLRIEHEPPHE